MEIEKMRIQYAFGLALTGLSLAVILVAFLVWRGVAANDVVAIVGLITSVLGTLVGAFFGLQIGAAGREGDREDRRQAQQITRMALARNFPVETRDEEGQ